RGAGRHPPAARRAHRVVGGEHVGEERGHDEQHHQHAAEGAQRILPHEEPEGGTPGALMEAPLGNRDLDRVDRHHACPYLMRGSSHVYSRSTTRFAVTTTTAISIARFCTIGQRRPWRAATRQRATPGSVKTV